MYILFIPTPGCLKGKVLNMPVTEFAPLCRAWGLGEGGFLTFGTGVLMSSDFLSSPNDVTNPNNQLSFTVIRNFQTEYKFLGTQEYQTPNKHI